MKDSDGRRIKLSVSGGVRKPAVRDRQRRINGGEPPSRTQPPNLTQSGLAQTNLTQSSLTTSSLAQHIQLSSARPQVRKIILFGYFFEDSEDFTCGFFHITSSRIFLSGESAGAAWSSTAAELWNS